MNKTPNIFKDHIFFKVYGKYFPIDESFWTRQVSQIIKMSKKDAKILFDYTKIPNDYCNHKELFQKDLINFIKNNFTPCKLTKFLKRNPELIETFL